MEWVAPLPELVAPMHRNMHPKQQEFSFCGRGRETRLRLNKDERFKICGIIVLKRGEK